MFFNNKALKLNHKFNLMLNNYFSRAIVRKTCTARATSAKKTGAGGCVVTWFARHRKRRQVQLSKKAPISKMAPPQVRHPASESRRKTDAS